MGRQYFDHLFVEFSVAAGELAPRYALWLRLRELGFDPMSLRRDDVLVFHDDHLAAFMAAHKLCISPREIRSLRKRLERYDPTHPTPDEILQRIFEATR